jgi:hypothetical protein
MNDPPAAVRRSRLTCLHLERGYPEKESGRSRDPHGGDLAWNRPRTCVEALASRGVQHARDHQQKSTKLSWRPHAKSSICVQEGEPDLRKAVERRFGGFFCLSRCNARHAAVGCESCRRSRSPTWRAGSWNVSTCPRGLRRSASRKEGPPSCRARSRLPICPGTMTPDSTSTSRVRRTVDRRPLIRERGPLDASSRDGFEKCRSTRIGRMDSLTLATAIPRAIARREPSARAPSLKSSPEGDS